MGLGPLVHNLGALFARAAMSDDNEIQSGLANRMDDAFCAAMRTAIEAGLESAPIGVVTTPGTKNPKYVPTEPRLLGFSLVDMDV